MVTLRMLGKLGYQVDAVGSGLEVLEALASKTYGIILMDCQMPGMDGFEATREIRNREGEARHTPIIAMTANAQYGDREACLKAGMDDYLSKPVDYKVLALVLENWLSKRQVPGLRQECSVVAAAHRSAAMGDEALESQGFQTTVDDNPQVSADFDKACFLDRVSGDEELAREIIEMFVLETPLQLEALESAMKAGDADQVRRLAHKLRGAAVSMCCRNLGDVAAGIEKAAKEADLVAAARLLPDLNTGYLAMKRLLNT